MAFLFKVPSSAAAAAFSTSSPLYSFQSSLAAVNGQGSWTWLYTTGAILFGLLVLEQTVYRAKKRHLPGDSWTIPIIGKFADSMKPTMESYKKQWDSGVLSAVSVFNIFIVVASSNDYARKILNSPTIFLTGKDHADYRRGLNGLFTRKAIGMYISIQDAVTRKHFEQWRKDFGSSPQPLMFPARYLNIDTSLRVFCGNHIPDEATREISDRYWDITVALQLVNFPIPFPGTKLYKAIQARKAAMHWLTLAAHNSKIEMANGGEPTCLLDQWVKVLNDPTYKGKRDFSDHEMALVVLSFLLASQDAMNSGLVYGFQHLVDHPEILAKVREEQEIVRKGNYETPLTIDLMDEMRYLNAVVKESLRVKPPVLMVPYKATKAFPISDDYTVSANSMIISSFWNSLHDAAVYPEPYEFIPERWLDPASPANANPKNYMVFGAGPHRCIGVEYGTMNIMLVLACAATAFDWEHEITPETSEAAILPTLFPKDLCRMKFTPRKQS
ncbi:Cytochrome P450 [Mycena sanguinolenta]|uniref:Cytochrome P450 n=1 Tax=Mycena sanguinolenta TaxID=230812 RepID=A0A8H6ZIH1_9AGAR|nr:Cytochrome P450 [Mycena sanguinolenta]